MIKKFKTMMLPIAMIIGALAHSYIGYIAFLSPFLIFLMLYVTFTRIELADLRLTKFHFTLLLVQLIGCWIAYFSLAWYNEIAAQGVFLCVFICTATSAPVITSMLGGSISRLLTYSLLSIIVFAICLPIFFPLISDCVQVSYLSSFTKISGQVIPLLLSPLLLASITRKIVPDFHKKIASHQSISFYLWAIALIIVVGNSVSYFINTPNKDIGMLCALFGGSLVVCILQFIIGHKIGKYFGDPVAGAQGLGQKNTVLAIWVALSYLNPITSLAPGAYVAWQNIINSMQLYLKTRKGDFE